MGGTAVAGESDLCGEQSKFRRLRLDQPRIPFRCLIRLLRGWHGAPPPMMTPLTSLFCRKGMIESMDVHIFDAGHARDAGHTTGRALPRLGIGFCRQGRERGSESEATLKSCGRSPLPRQVTGLAACSFCDISRRLSEAGPEQGEGANPSGSGPCETLRTEITWPKPTIRHASRQQIG